MELALKREAKFIILGKPIPWARPGKSRYSRVAYDTQKDQKEDYKWFFKSEHGNAPLFEGPLHLDLKFFMPVTESHAKRKLERVGNPHIFVPDLSNLVKFVEDAAVDVLFADDRTIASINAIKIWDETPRTEMIIREL